MKKRWMTVFCVVLFTMLIMTAADTKAAAKKGAWDTGKKEVQAKGAFTYYIHPSKNGKEAWIYKIKIKSKKSRTLSIPKTIQGKKVTRLGRPELGSEEDDEAYATLFDTYVEPWNNWDGKGIPFVSSLKSIQIPDTVKVIDQAAFSGLNSVTTIKLPKKVKKIEEYTFYGCSKLKTVILPEQMESFENSSLMDCPALKSIKLSKKNKQFKVKKNCLIRKKDKALIVAAARGKKFSIPNGIKTITSYSFRSASCSVVHIPASVTKIEKKAFDRYDLYKNPNIRDVTISKKNPVFTRDGQCIYKKSDKSLAVAISDNKRELRISERVKKLPLDISVIVVVTELGGYLEKVVYPSGLKRVTAPGVRELDARNVYFTGSVPPKIVSRYGKRLPIGHIYVPKAYADVYKAWYKQNNYYDMVDGWHTYNP